VKNNKKILISDFTTKEAPHGGSEWVNEVLIKKFNLDFEYSSQLQSWDPENFYIISNISLMDPTLVREIPKLNYIIIENDYKICESRHPWRYPNSIVPKNQRINYDIYKNAKAVFVQTTDHLNVYKANHVEGNFINLNCSIWSDEDLEMLNDFLTNKPIKNGKTAVYYTNNWIKNSEGAINYCNDNGLTPELIENNPNRKDFLDKLSSCSQLVFLPIARETFCRLVVEARCMGLEVITTKNYGASLENWFDMKGADMLKFLKFKTDKNLKIIENYINN
jgi:hypothetical protein